MVAYYLPIIKISNSRYTPWRVRTRVKESYINVEVDSVAGQFYTFLPHSRRALVIACVTVRHVLLFTLPATLRHIIAIHHLDHGAVLLGHTLVYDVTIYLGGF